MRTLIIVFSLSVSFLFVSAQKPSATLDHVALYVQHLDSSVAFYRRLFDFETIANPFPGAKVTWLKIGNGLQLHLVEGLKEPVSVPFMTHICVSVSSLHEFMGKLDKLGVSYYSGPDMVRGINHRPDGVDQIFVRDPDKYLVEINDAKHPEHE